jgi:hypothetical protein
MLTPQAAQKAGLIYDHRTILTTLGGEKVIPSSSRNSVAIGSEDQTGVEIVVSDLSHVRELDRKADGVLGQSFLNRAPYLIDYSEKRLWLGDKAEELAAGLPISVLAGRLNGRTVLPVVLEPGAKPWQLTLDSGASHLVVECGGRCPRASEVQPAGQLLTYTGERSVVGGKLRRIEVGELAISWVQAILVGTSGPDDKDQGVLPTRWFSAVFVSGNQVRLGPVR